MSKNKAKILLIDLETAPSLGYFWEMWETNIIEVTKHGYMLSASLKWLGEKKIYWFGLNSFKGYKKGDDCEKKLLEKICEFTDQAEVILAQNGDRFDLPTLNTRLVFHGLNPLPQHKTIDTLKVARSKFKFISNKLDDLGSFLNVGRKLPHTGKKLWLDCMNGKKSAWKLMEKYNKQDIVLLEKVYLKLRPFMTNHPNIVIISGDRTKFKCPVCMSSHYHKKSVECRLGYDIQRLRCADCGKYFYGEKTKK